LAEITSRLDHELFWVGSGGLARELATLPDLFSNPPSEPLIHETTKERIEALIVDAHTGGDLKRLAEITSRLDHELFWVGSGGLARELATLPDLFSNPPSEPLIHE
ncbi:four-carbon acid sugar kinase family protein, partial [Caballeronia sp. M23-90]